MRTLEDWKAGADVRNNARHQQSPEAIRELQRAVVQGGPVNQTGRGLESYLCRVVTEGPDAEGDYSDPRYWLERLYVVETPYRFLPTFERDRIDELTEFDGNPGEPAIITATNTAEIPGDTHLLAEGDYVWVWTEWDRADPSQHHYLFNRPPGTISDLMFAVLTGEETADGVYTADELIGTSVDIDITGTFGYGAGIATASEVIVYDLQEYPAHPLAAGQRVIGKFIGYTDEATPRQVMVINGGRAKETNNGFDLWVPATSGSQDYWKAATGVNEVNPDDPGVVFPVLRGHWDSVNHVFYGYFRDVSADGTGHLINITDEDTHGENFSINFDLLFAQQIAAYKAANPVW